LSQLKTEVNMIRNSEECGAKKKEPVKTARNMEKSKQVWMGEIDEN